MNLAARTSDLRDHLCGIAAAHNLEIIWLTTRIGYAHRGQRCVRIPHPTTPLRYLLGLHEMGHCLAPNAWWGRMIESEAVAWRWAFEQSRLPITPRIRRAVRGRLDRYLEYGPGWGAVLPGPQSPFWAFHAAL